MFMYILDEIDRLKPIIGHEKTASLKSAFLLEDEDGRKRIIEVVDAIKAIISEKDEFRDIVLVEPPPEDVAADGEIQLGTIFYGRQPMYDYKLKKSDFLTHIGIFGSSGYGKTNAIQWLITELNEQQIPMIIFDFSKRNYRDLIKIPELKGKLQIYTVGRNVSPFRFNPLIPPENVQISQWIKEFAEIFDHAYWLLGGGRHIIMKALDEIYRNAENPKISHIKEWLEKYSYATSSSREKNWLATAQRPLESLCFRETKEIFDCDKGVQPSSFFEPGKITVFELDALSTNDRTFFIEILLQWLRDWLLTSKTREKLIGSIIIEEAHHVLNREQARRLGMETVTDLIFREIRELGVGIIYADQHPSLVSYPALGNTSIHIYMNLGLDTKTSSDVVDAANMLGLSEDEEIDFLRRLPVGHAFVLNRKSVFPKHFLIGFPFIKLERGNVTDEDVRNLMNVKAVETYQEVKRIEEEKFEAKTKEEPDIGVVDLNMWKIIECLGNGDGTYSSEIYKQLKMSGSTFKKTVEKMINFNLVQKKKIRIYKQTLVYYFLTGKGKKLFEGRFGEFKIKDKVSDDDRKLMEDKFLSENWEKISDEKNSIIFKKGQKKINIKFIESSGDILPKDINEILESELWFICSNDKTKNKIIQKIIEYSMKKKINFQFVLMIPEEFKKDKNLKTFQLI